MEDKVETKEETSFLIETKLQYQLALKITIRIVPVYIMKMPNPIGRVRTWFYIYI
jgi:hypothetical protein